LDPPFPPLAITKISFSALTSPRIMPLSVMAVTPHGTSIIESLPESPKSFNFLQFGKYDFLFKK
jgi:hypothetical protein